MLRAWAYGGVGPTLRGAGNTIFYSFRRRLGAPAALEENHVHSVGRLLQMVALAIPLLAILMQLSGGLDVKRMLVAAVAAISLFYIGRIIEGYSKR
jgi:hypothetical protein